ncbi:MAG: acyl-CoA thioesterase [Actinomycetia bacterium]|nr:acyl-CoA thioesterase [Actinomycetes bacterium]MCP4227518.1 acyl-CoA thioesterase [Actinomycetes bacterium]MCP5033011.1 acyl-CoA thioesterase [Actinomycetes bacterium]
MRDFLGLEPTGDPSRWRLPVSHGICGGRGAIYGGCGLAASIEAAEAQTGRPTAWATCQFLKPAHTGSVIDLQVTMSAVGRAVSHGRVIATVDDQEVFVTLISLGQRPFPAAGVWATMPDVSGPEGLPARYIRAENKGGLRERITELAVTDDPDGIMRNPDGRCAMWITMPDGVPGTASALAVIGDEVSTGTSAVIEPDLHAPSIDNTLRVVNPKATDWVLADIELRSVSRGFAHGIVNLWSQDGDLLAIATQTGVVRVRGT